jgi:hypothetical protein|tara:strand:+ start:277 stop:471 length:195 start_codon:yes stop_codon:yes gene_type:complete
MFFKVIKEWITDWNEAQRELNKTGVFTVYHTFGASTHYIAPTKTTHINTVDDKSKTIRTNYTKS